MMYIDEMTDPATGRTGYKEKGSFSSRERGDELIWPFDTVEAMTAVSMFSRVMAGNLLGNLKKHQLMIRKGTELLMEKLPNWDEKAGTIDFYYWYHGTNAMYQVGGESWKAWKNALIRALIENQETEGCLQGSWDPSKEPWGDSGGRIYCTALGALAMESFYRYEVLTSQRGIRAEKKSAEETLPPEDGSGKKKAKDGSKDDGFREKGRFSETWAPSNPLSPPVKGFHGKYAKRADMDEDIPGVAAVKRGLDWLARHQHPDGYWDCDGFDLQCRNTRCSGKGHALNDVGVTGLAILAFLGAGHSPTQGAYKMVVSKGVDYLIEVQDRKDGCLTAKAGEHFMYNHGIASLALVEAWGLSHRKDLIVPVHAALQYIHESKNPGKAWRYNIGQRDPMEGNDVSVTSWMLVTLITARDFGLPVYEKDLKEGMRYLEDMTDPKRGRTGYKAQGSYSSREAGDELIWPFDGAEALTAAAMLCRIFASDMVPDKISLPGILDKGRELLKKVPPDGDAKEMDYHYLYYGTLAMYQLGGADWTAWRDRVVKALEAGQIRKDCAAGSWDPQRDPWGDNGGRVYSTALCTLCLETFFRYDRVAIPR